MTTMRQTTMFEYLRESTEEVYYYALTLRPTFLRLAGGQLVPVIDQQIVLSRLKNYPTYKRAIVSYEVLALRPHYQIILGLTSYEKIGSAKSGCKLRQFIQDNFTFDKSIDCTIAEARSKNLQKYVLKEESWVQDGFDYDKLKSMEKRSFIKKNELMKQLDILEEQYMDGRFDEAEYCARIEYHKSRANQTRNPNYVSHYVGSKEIKKKGLTDDLIDYWKQHYRSPYTVYETNGNCWN